MQYKKYDVMGREILFILTPCIVQNSIHGDNEVQWDF